MTTLTFLTLFLGLTTGVHPVTVDVDGPAARVEVLLNGTACGARERPPWRFRCDFGDELAPHRLGVRAFDAEGRELAAESQLVNLVPRQSAVEMTVERDGTGKPRALRLAWQALSAAAPAAVRVEVDGEPVAVDEPTRVALPRTVVGDPDALHFATAELTFPDGSTARTEITFGGTFGDAVSSRNSAVPVIHRQGRRIRDPEAAEGLLQTAEGDAGGSPAPLRPVAVESGAADLVAVVEGSALEELAGLREDFSGLHGRGGRTGLARGDRFFLVDPVPRRRAAAGAGGPDPGYDVFATSPPRDVGDGGLAWQLSHVQFPAGRAQHLADAVAMAAMQATTGGRPRAVLLVLGPEAEDRSRHSAAQVRRFLDRLRVPLVVWWVERDPSGLAPRQRAEALAQRAQRSERRIAFAAAWGGVETVTGYRDLLAAAERLRDAVGRQSVLWVEGVHLPHRVALADPARDLELLGADSARGPEVRTASELAAALPAELLAEVGPEATSGPAAASGGGAAEDRGSALDPDPGRDPAATPGSVRPAGAAGPTLLTGGGPATFADSLRVDLVEVEAVVADRHGRPVTDLGPDEFEVYEDGRRVEVTHFSPPPPAPRGAPAGGGEAPGAAAAEPSSPPLHLVIYLDDAHMAPEQRNAMLDRLPPLFDALPPGTGVQVVVRDAGLRARLQDEGAFHRDPDAVLAALRRAAGGSGSGQLRDREMRRAVAQIEAQSNLDDALRAAELYASQRMVEVRGAVADLAAVVDSLAPLPGRKAILYLGSDLPLPAGREAFLAVERIHGAGAYGRTGHPALRAAENDATRHYRELVRRANAARVTFYGFDAAGLRLPATAGVEQRAWSPLVGLDAELAENVARPLQLLAQGTGGFAVTGRNDLAPALERLAADVSAAYVLGYPAPAADPGDSAADAGEVRRLEVRVTRPGLRVRHREAYRPRTVDERMTDAVLAALTVPPPPAALAPELVLGEAAALADGSLRVPVRVHVPLSELVLTLQGDFYVTRLDLFVAVAGAAGEPSPVRHAEVAVELPAERAAEARGFYTVTLPLRMEPGEGRLAVGVRDRTTGAEGVAARPARVEPPASPLRTLVAESREAGERPVAGAELLGRKLIPGGWVPGPVPDNPADRHPFTAGRRAEDRSPW